MQQDRTVLNQRIGAIVSNLLENTTAELFVTVTGSVDGHESMMGGGGSGSVSGIGGGGGLLSTLIGETSVTEKWLRGDMTNFQEFIQIRSKHGSAYYTSLQSF